MANFHMFRIGSIYYDSLVIQRCVRFDKAVYVSRIRLFVVRARVSENLYLRPLDRENASVFQLTL